MDKFSKDEAYKILMNEIGPEMLAEKYPKIKEMVMEDISAISKESSLEDIVALIDRYKTTASNAMGKIRKSEGNPKTVNRYLPEIIKARIAIHIIEQLNSMAKSGKSSGRIRFNLWDGFILQKILFKKDLERKPASLFCFKLFWPFITNKKILMPLVNKKGIYCFYSKAFLKDLAMIIGDSTCIEIGAGDGTLTRFLNNIGIDCKATDDYSWKHYIQYPDFVENMDAKTALKKYKPETVICSWAPPGNTFEKSVFEMDSVKLYIVIGTKNPLFSGNHVTYQNQKNFNMELDPRLSVKILPPSKDNMVYIFKRNF